MFGVDESAISIPEKQADTVPIIDFYHRKFINLASCADTSEDEESEGESVQSESEEDSSSCMDSESFDDL